MLESPDETRAVLADQTSGFLIGYSEPVGQFEDAPSTSNISALWAGMFVGGLFGFLGTLFIVCPMYGRARR